MKKPGALEKFFLLAVVLAVIGLVCTTAPDMARLGSDYLPPVERVPTREELHRAIDRGIQAYVERFFEPAWKRVQSGTVEHIDPSGSRRQLSPEIYVQADLYLVVHFLLYHDRFGVPATDPRVLAVRRWLREKLSPEGRWIWSEEGCLHAKGMIALARAGDHEPTLRAWKWIQGSDLNLRDLGLFTMRQSGRIIQTLGPGSLSLTGKVIWEHGSPKPDIEQSSKLLYALLRAGKAPDEPDVKVLLQGISRYVEERLLDVDLAPLDEILGLTWFLTAHVEFELPRGTAYKAGVGWIQTAMRGRWRQNNSIGVMPLVRAKMCSALLVTGAPIPEIDSHMAGYIRGQRADGSWSSGRSMAPSETGIRMGDLDGATTYALTLSLLNYRDRRLSPPPEGSTLWNGP